jgi:hypothetical protein
VLVLLLLLLLFRWVLCSAVLLHKALLRNTECTKLLLLLRVLAAAGLGLTLAGLHEGLHIVGGRIETHLKEVGLACRHV